MKKSVEAEIIFQSQIDWLTTNHRRLVENIHLAFCQPACLRRLSCLVHIFVWSMKYPVIESNEFGMLIDVNISNTIFNFYTQNELIMVHLIQSIWF